MQLNQRPAPANNEAVFSFGAQSVNSIENRMRDINMSQDENLYDSNKMSRHLSNSNMVEVPELV